MQEKDEYQGMEKSGVTFDGFKRSPYYMDTVIHVVKRRDVKSGNIILVGEVEKDRTGKLPARIEPFGIDALRKYWGDFFKQGSESSGNVFEEPEIPTVIVPAASEPVAPAAGTPGTTAAKPVDRASPAAAPAAAEPITAEEPAHAKKAEKLKALLELRAELKIPDAAWAAILEKRNAKKVEKLSEKAIVEILGKLENKLDPAALAAWVARYPFRAGATAPTG
jgi:hypothetical protein